MIKTNNQPGTIGECFEQKPLLSVCIITYNHESYIAQAIESVLSQTTDFPFEIIIGEDDSSDNTRNIVVGYRDRYPDKIRVILNDRNNVIYVNGRATGRRNFIQTFSSATSKYVALVEGDDYWIDPSKLQNQVSFLETHPEYAVCGHLVEVVDSKGERLANDLLGKNCPEIFSIKDALNGPPVHTSSLVFRNFDLETHAAYPYLLILPAADVLLHPMLLSLGNGHCFDKTWSAYRSHPGGFWSAKPNYLKHFEFFQVKYAFYKLYPEYFHANLWANLGSILSQSFISAITSALRCRSIAPIFRLSSIAAKQNVVPIQDFILFNIIALSFIPLRLVIMIFKK